jgi:hypothetical protein
MNIIKQWRLKDIKILLKMLEIIILIAYLSTNNNKLNY